MRGCQAFSCSEWKNIHRGWLSTGMAIVNSHSYATAGLASWTMARQTFSSHQLRGKSLFKKDPAKTCARTRESCRYRFRITSQNSLPVTAVCCGFVGCGQKGLHVILDHMIRCDNTKLMNFHVGLNTPRHTTPRHATRVPCVVSISSSWKCQLSSSPSHHGLIRS